MNSLHRKDGTFKTDEFVFRVDNAIVTQQVMDEFTAKYANKNKEQMLSNLGTNPEQNAWIRKVAAIPNYNKSWDEKGLDVLERQNENKRLADQREKDLQKKWARIEDYYSQIADEGFTEE